jgi:hypothetical protein
MLVLDLCPSLNLDLYQTATNVGRINKKTHKGRPSQEQDKTVTRQDNHETETRETTQRQARQPTNHDISQAMSKSAKRQKNIF